MNIAWIISIPLLGVLFLIDSYFAKKNKVYEFEIYRLEVKDLDKTKN